MIEVINNVAYLRNITDPKQSQEMYVWLKEHTNTELYLIKGQKDYGCDSMGGLVKFENMPLNKVKNGLCVSDWYIPQNNEIKPLTGRNSSDNSNSIDLSKETITRLDDANESLKNDIGSGTFYVDAEKLAELSNMCVNYENIAKRLELDKSELNEVIESLNDKITCLENANLAMRSEKDKEKERADVLEEELAISIQDSDKVSKTDVTGLCKALYDLGFIVDISYSPLYDEKNN